MVARTLPATWTVPWRLLFVVGWFALSAWMLLDPWVRYLSFMPNDWQLWTWLRPGTLYDETWHVWAPPVMWLLVYVIVPAGFAWWWAAHVVALLTLRDWTLIALTVLSVPFWADAMNGQTVTFAFVAGALALRRSRFGVLSFLALAVLIPRPLIAPLTLWLLWREPWARLPFAGIVAAVVTIAAVSGDLAPWVGNMLTLASGGVPWWLIAGVPAAVWLTVKGRVGFAGLAMSPYVLPMYPLVLLWEWVIDPPA